MESEKESVKDLIVDVSEEEVRLALLDNHRLIELNKESSNGHSFTVGDVFLGKVKKVMPALNAAFVDIGDEKEAFIHYLDLGLYFNAFDEFVRKTNTNTNAKDLFTGIELGPILAKEGQIENHLKPGQMVIVQIVKEPISTKGSRLTAEISLAGRNIVLLPFAKKVSISQKIASKEEKKRLETLVRSILPPNYGAIIRTAAEGKNAAILVSELKSLISKWESSWTKLSKSKNVQLLFTEYSKTTTILRDLFNDSFSNIYVNDQREYEEIKKYIAQISPDKEKIVKFYDGDEPLFDKFDVTRQIKSSFGKVVPIKQGAYLVIESTEALNVVDVNSGIRAKTNDQEENTYEVNRYAAEEIARQLRLRDMGGIIIVDFIDMENQEHKNGLYKFMSELMQEDRAKHNVLPLTKFGLMQITRQRVRPVAVEEVKDVCPTCGGTGKIEPTILLDKKIENKISYLAQDAGHKYIKLRVSPYVSTYLNHGLWSLRRRWMWKYKIQLKIVADQSVGIVDVHYYDKEGKDLYKD